MEMSQLRQLEDPLGENWRYITGYFDATDRFFFRGFSSR